MRICIDSDETGTELKAEMKILLLQRGLYFRDPETGPHYPEVACKMARLIRDCEYDRGILICGSGMGMAMMATKIATVYAAVCRDTCDAKELAHSKGGNILCLGSTRTPRSLARDIVNMYLDTTIAGGENSDRMRMLASVNNP